MQSTTLADDPASKLSWDIENKRRETTDEKCSWICKKQCWHYPFKIRSFKSRQFKLFNSHQKVPHIFEVLVSVQGLSFSIMGLLIGVILHNLMITFENVKPLNWPPWLHCYFFYHHQYGLGEREKKSREGKWFFITSQDSNLGNCSWMNFVDCIAQNLTISQARNEFALWWLWW